MKPRHTLAAVFFEMTVLNEDGSVARVLPKKRNLLLDRGLNELADRKWTELFAYFALGTSSNPTSRDSALTTVTVAGGIATASAGFFEAADVGRLLKADSGAERTITGYTSPTVVNVAGGDVAESQFTVWYVNDTSLGALDHTFNLRSGDSGDHGWSWNGETGVLSTWVTRVSAAVSAAAKTFKEIGWATSPGGLVNGRALINGGVGDTLVTGQKYKVKLTLERTITPRVARACPQVAGWTGTAQEICECAGYSYWNTSGDSVASGAIMEPSSTGDWFLSATAAPLRALIFRGDGTQPDLGTIGGSMVGATNSAYVANSFRRTVTGFWDAGVVVSSEIRSVVYGDYWGGAIFQFRKLMSEPQTKTSAQKLTQTLVKTWGRVLVN